MNEFKLVPVEPTEEMATAAMNAETTANMLYGEPASFIDIWNAMLAAAPAVQGKPVAYMFVDDWGRTKIVLGKETAETWCPPGEEIKPLYTAPQSAEQQPSPDVLGMVEVLERARDRLESERRSGEFDPLIRDIDDALAAYRKGGE